MFMPNEKGNQAINPGNKIAIVLNYISADVVNPACYSNMIQPQILELGLVIWH